MVVLSVRLVRFSVVWNCSSYIMLLLALCVVMETMDEYLLYWNGHMNVKLLEF